MTVAELIEELKKINNQDARVIMCNGDIVIAEVGNVTQQEDPRLVYLEE